MWTWSNNILLGGIFFQIVKCIHQQSQSLGLPYTQSPHTVNLKILPSLNVPQVPGSPHLTGSNPSLNTFLSKYRPLLALHSGYGIFVRIGHQAVILEVDTSSSDTWVADSYYGCVDSYGNNLPQPYCQVGPTFSSDTGCGTRDVKDTHFNVQYADYDRASGPMAVVPLRIADNITVNQQIGIARNVVTLYGRDNVTSGVLGLAYSSLTSSYPGTDIWGTDACITAYTIHPPDNETSRTDENICDRKTYASLSETLFSSNLSNTQNFTFLKGQNVFSLALSRSTVGNLYGGSITFGGLPDVTLPQVNATGVFVDVPNEPLKGDQSGELSYYLVSIEGIVIPVDDGVLENNTSISADRDGSDPLTSTAVMRRRKVMESHRHAAVRSGTQLTKLDTSMNTNTDNHKDDTLPVNTNPHPNSKTTTLKTIPQDSQFKIDSSSPYSYFPAPIVKAYNSLFQPHAYRQHRDGPWLLNCSALSYIPPLGLVIGGEMFWHGVADLVIRIEIKSEDGEGKEAICYSAIQEPDSVYGNGDWDGNISSGGEEGSGEGDGDANQDPRDVHINTTYTLGQPFLKNVLAVFDVGKGRIGLMSRAEYETEAGAEIQN